jgi:hypothetical protein
VFENSVDDTKQNIALLDVSTHQEAVKTRLDRYKIETS